MADDDLEEDGHEPGQCANCDGARVWIDIKPVFDQHAAKTGRGQYELVHLAICRYVDSLLAHGAQEQAEHLVAELALIVMSHRGEQDEAEEEAQTTTKH
jgi:hypothetical protein